MSNLKGELNSDKEILYLVQWFTEFSEFQRLDFLNDHLSQLYRPFFKENIFMIATANGDSNSNESSEIKNDRSDNLLHNEMDSLNINQNDRPPSIFQCRMKLFREWYQIDWKDIDKIEFLLRLKNIDSQFVFDLYRILIKEQNFLDKESFLKFFEGQQISQEESVIKCRNLAERLDMFNEGIFKTVSDEETKSVESPAQETVTAAQKVGTNQENSDGKPEIEKTVISNGNAENGILNVDEVPECLPDITSSKESKQENEEAPQPDLLH